MLQCPIVTVILSTLRKCLIFLEQPGDEDVSVVAGPRAGADEPVLELAPHGRVVDGPRLHEGAVGRRADGPVQAVLLLAVPQKLQRDLEVRFWV